MGTFFDNISDSIIQNHGNSYEIISAVSRCPAAGNGFQKYLIPGSLVFSSNFHEIFHLILLRIIDLCLEMPSDSKTFFGFVVERLFELGHNTKSRCFRHLENIRALTHGVNSHRNIHKGYRCNPLRGFKICSEMPSDSKQCFGFVVGEFSKLGHTRDSRLTSTVLKKN